MEERGGEQGREGKERQKERGREQVNFLSGQLKNVALETEMHSQINVQCFKSI